MIPAGFADFLPGRQVSRNRFPRPVSAVRIHDRLAGRAMGPPGLVNGRVLPKCSTGIAIVRNVRREVRRVGRDGATVRGGRREVAIMRSVRGHRSIVRLIGRHQASVRVIGQRVAIVRRCSPTSATCATSLPTMACCAACSRTCSRSATDGPTIRVPWLRTVRQPPPLTQALAGQSLQIGHFHVLRLPPRFRRVCKQLCLTARLVPVAS